MARTDPQSAIRQSADPPDRLIVSAAAVPGPATRLPARPTEKRTVSARRRSAGRDMDGLRSVVTDVSRTDAYPRQARRASIYRQPSPPCMVTNNVAEIDDSIDTTDSVSIRVVRSVRTVQLSSGHTGRFDSVATPCSKPVGDLSAAPIQVGSTTSRRRGGHAAGQRYRNESRSCETTHRGTRHVRTPFGDEDRAMRPRRRIALAPGTLRVTLQMTVWFRPKFHILLPHLAIR